MTVYLYNLLGTSGRSQAAFSSKMAKRRKTVEMREKVQSQGAFSARAHERSAETAGTSSALEVCSFLYLNLDLRFYTFHNGK